MLLHLAGQCEYGTMRWRVYGEKLWLIRHFTGGEFAAPVSLVPSVTYEIQWDVSDYPTPPDEIWFCPARQETTVAAMLAYQWARVGYKATLAAKMNHLETAGTNGSQR